MKVRPHPPKTVAFPIHRKATGTDSYAQDAPFRIGFLPPAVQDTIERLQPYHRGNDPKRHPLWILNERWNGDKHRASHIVGMALAKSTVDVEVIGGTVQYLELRTRRIEDGAILARFQVAPPDAQVAVYGNQSSEIVFDVAGLDPELPVVATLTTIYEHIRVEVLPRFVQFLT